MIKIDLKNIIESILIWIIYIYFLFGAFLFICLFIYAIYYLNSNI